MLIYQRFYLDMHRIGITTIIGDNIKYKHIWFKFHVIKKLMPSEIQYLQITRELDLFYYIEH